jgi:hypothetical protein
MTASSRPVTAVPPSQRERAALAEALTRDQFAHAISLVVEMFGDSHRCDVRTVTAVAQVMASNYRALAEQA